MLIALLLPIATSCGGRERVADCGELAYCPATDVCCPVDAVCGTGDNGCPLGGCCIGHAAWDAGASHGDDAGWPSEPPYYPSAGTDGPSPPAGRGRPVAS